QTCALPIYLLPMQEIMFGNMAWVLNGLLWAWVLHIALKWHVIGMIPSMLAAQFIAHYTQSTWASFAVQAIGTVPLWFILIIGLIVTKYISYEHIEYNSNDNY